MKLEDYVDGSGNCFIAIRLLQDAQIMKQIKQFVDDHTNVDYGNACFMLDTTGIRHISIRRIKTGIFKKPVYVLRFQDSGFHHRLSGKSDTAKSWKDAISKVNAWL